MFFAINISVFFLEEGDVFLRMKRAPTGFLGVFSWIMLIVLIVAMVNYVNMGKESNADKFVSNLQLKYSISEVNLFEGKPDLMDSGNLYSVKDSDIEVTTKDGVRVRFLITVDPTTSEPTLKEPTAIGVIRANDLLNNRGDG